MLMKLQRIRHRHKNCKAQAKAESQAVNGQLSIEKFYLCFLFLFAMRQLLILLSLCLLVASCGHTSPQDKVLLARADSLMEAHPDSALTLLKHITDSKRLSSSDHALYALLMSQALDKNNIEVQSDSLIRVATNYYNGAKDSAHAGYAFFYLARVEGNRENPEGRAAALLKAGTYATKSNNYKLLGLVYSDKAREYKEQQQLDSMSHYNWLAFSAFQKAGDRRNSVVALISIGNSYSLHCRFDSALTYYCLAKKAALPLHDDLLLSSIYRLSGAAYCYEKNYPMALRYFRLSVRTSDVYDYRKWINFAVTYLQIGKLDSARFYLAKCGNPHEMAPDYYRLWQELYEKKGNLRAALYFAKKDSDAKDSLNQLSLKESFAGLEKKYNYQQIAVENNHLLISNERNKWLVLLLLLCLSLACVVVLLRKKRRKRQQFSQEQTLTLKEEALRAKEQEANALLKKQLGIQQAMLLNINDQKKEMQTQMEQASGIEKKEITHILNEKEEVISALCREIISNVDALYDHISQRLTGHFPELTSGDILICSLLLAGFESSSITSLLDIQAKSYNMRRTTLRKRLGLAHDVNLTDFLANF
jgi:cbb3-type cytochrome oxidase subunit 3